MAATGYTSSTGDGRKVSKSGDTMTGELELPDSSPDGPLRAASRGYVDAAVAAASGGVPSNSVASETAYGQVSAAGASAQYARGDHTHGTPAAPTVGTTAGTYAAGDDARIAGAAQKAQNLADLTDPVVARTSLGLGSAATHPVGDFDAAGAAAAALAAAISTAAGDATTKANAAQSAATAAAEADAADKYLPLDGGGTVTGNVTIAEGNVHVDSTGTAINSVNRGSTDNYAAYSLVTAGVDRWAWQMQPGSQDLYLVDSANGSPVLRVAPGVTPVVTFLGDVAFDGAGGGGGATIRTVDSRITAGDVALSSSVSWAVVTSGSTQLAASITAAVGDRIQASPSFMRTGSGSFLDLAILDPAGAISRFFGTDSSSPLTEGHPSYYPQAASFPGVPGAMQIVVGSGEVDGSGKATIALAYQGSGGETIYAGPTYPFYLLLTNIGAEPSS